MVEPKCPFYGKCGGCSAQHIEYSMQVENKRKIVERVLGYEKVKVYTGKEYGYRNRMDFIFHTKGLGFREKGNWKKIIDIDKCIISNDKLNLLLTEVRSFFKKPDAFNVHIHTGTLRYAVIRTPQEDSSISFVINSKSSRIKEAVGLIEEFSKKTTAKNVVITFSDPKRDISISDDPEEYYTVKGELMLEEKFLGKQFIYSVQGFFQNNHEMAEKMHEHVDELLKGYDTQGYSLVDLYAGVGTFGIINSEKFKETFIVEGVKSCIDAAKENIVKNKVKAETVLLDAMQLKKLKLPEKLFAITDPPRSGMHLKTIDELKRLKPELIVYISCNPEQLGKEIVKFKDYNINSAALFDLFPQTPHSEVVVEMKRRLGDKK